MIRERATYELAVDLDPVPGTFHDAEETAGTLQAILAAAIPHYRPTVQHATTRNALCESCEQKPATREVDLRTGDHAVDSFRVCEDCA